MPSNQGTVLSISSDFIGVDKILVFSPQGTTKRRSEETERESDIADQQTKPARVLWECDERTASAFRQLLQATSHSRCHGRAS